MSAWDKLGIRLGSIWDKFFMVFHGLSLFSWCFIVFSWFFHGFSLFFYGFLWFFQRTGFQRTGNPSVFIVGHPSMNSLMDIHQ